MKITLENESVRTLRAQTCKETSGWLKNQNQPHLVFTDTVLSDGTWAEMLDLAARAPGPVNVIVISPRADLELYLDVMTRGAFDFVTELFTAPELGHVVRCAVDDAVRRRQAQAGFVSAP